MYFQSHALFAPSSKSCPLDGSFESGDRLQRTGYTTPPPVHALTTQNIKTCKRTVHLNWQACVSHKQKKAENNYNIGN